MQGSLQARPFLRPNPLIILHRVAKGDQNTFSGFIDGQVGLENTAGCHYIKNKKRKFPEIE